MPAILSATIWMVTATLTILLFFVDLFFTIILFPFDKKRKVVHAQCYWWANAIIGLNPYWSVKVKGLENIDARKAYVMVANHQSLADVIIMYKIHAQFKWVAKESLFKVPFLGWCLSLGRHIRLSRGRFGSIKKVYREAADWLRRGMSVLFFPEGTRSDTGTISAFQNGAFKLAIKEKKPILPIAITGTGNAIPKGSWVFKTKAHGTITILPPVDVENFKPGDFVNLRDIVHTKLKTAASPA